MLHLLPRGCNKKHLRSRIIHEPSRRRTCGFIQYSSPEPRLIVDGPLRSTSRGRNEPR